MKKIIIYLILIFLIGILRDYVFADENWDIKTIDNKCIFDKKKYSYLIKQEKPPYTNYDNKSINELYSKYFQDLKINKNINSNDDPFIKAKIVYRETQNLIFNCAILNSKLKIGQKVINLVQEQKGGSTNTINQIIKQNENLINQIKQNECTDLGTTDKNITFKLILLENVTYQNCIYSFYLDYMNKYFKNNINSIKKVSETNLNTEDISKIIANSAGDVAREVVHSQTVYNQALIAYSEFENTYGIHLLLLFIYDDFVELRSNLEKTLSPLSQFFFKIPRAQKQ